MSRSRLHYYDAKSVRDFLRDVHAKAELMQKLEEELIEQLLEVDEHRFFVRYGFKSLRTYIIQSLRFSRTQGQRITTAVRRRQWRGDDQMSDHEKQESNDRRIQTTAQIEHEGHGATQPDLDRRSNASNKKRMKNAHEDHTDEFFDEAFWPRRAPTIVRFGQKKEPQSHQPIETSKAESISTTSETSAASTTTTGDGEATHADDGLH